MKHAPDAEHIAVRNFEPLHHPDGCPESGRGVFGRIAADLAAIKEDCHG